MAPRELVRDAVERVVLSGHVGKSGAGLERVRLADGRSLVVKRIEPGTDFTVEATGGLPGHEYELWRSGVLDHLPRGVGHALVDAWTEDGATVLVMRDLGSDVLTWDDRLSIEQTRWVMTRVAQLHRAFLGSPPAGLAPLLPVVTLFAPDRVRPSADLGVELMQLALRGWEVFAEVVAPDVAEPVLALLADPASVVNALAAGPTTFVHGDLATVNLAIEGDTLTLIDWAMPTAGPGALDVARFIAGCSSVVALSREGMIEAYRLAAGPAYDDASMAVALLSTLMWLGWNKALDAVEHPDPAIRERERADLDWWVARARTTLESGAIRWT
jgi:hypothetical protein